MGYNPAGEYGLYKKIIKKLLQCIIYYDNIIIEIKY